MKHSIALMTMLLTLAACNGGSGGGSKKTKTPPPTAPAASNYTGEKEEPGNETPLDTEFQITKTRKEELQSDLSNFDAYKKELNNWKIKIQSRSGSYQGAKVVCKNIAADSLAKTQSSLMDYQGKAELELSVDSPNEMKVDYKCKILDRDIEIGRVLIQLKKSILVSGKQNIIALSLSDSAKIETLVLDTGAVLLTDGANVNLTMNELISNGGKIATYDADVAYVPLPNEPGKSGGVININTERANGTIAFELRGLPAGTQTKAQSDQYQDQPADRSLDGHGNICIGDRGIGKKGHTGLPGLPGVVGHKGGDAGHLIFRSSASNTLKMKVLPLPGAGGLGGPGGKGGQGGPGGKGAVWGTYYRAGKMMPAGHCKNGVRGDIGSTGKTGEPGPAGNIPVSSVIYHFEDKFFDIDSDWSN
jgi:hypothetical protein